MAVFFTVPFLVANMRKSSSGNERHVMTAAMRSSSVKGTRFTIAEPRAVRWPIGSSCTLRRYTLPLFEKNST